MEIYYPKTESEFLEMIINTANRNPDMKLSELICIKEFDDDRTPTGKLLCCGINVEAYNKNRTYANRPI